MTWYRHLNRLNVGLGCCVVGLALLVPTAAANAVLVAFQTAQPCAAGESIVDGCYSWLAGRVAALGIGKAEDSTGPGRVYVNLLLDLPVGQRTVTLATATLPPGRPRVGDTIDAKLWRGQITDVRLAGVTVGAVSRPATRFLLLLDVAVVVFTIGLLFLAGYAVDRRAGYV